MIGGNVTVNLQRRTSDRNELGEQVSSWTLERTLTGWLDYLSGESTHTAWNTELAESSHVFLCDWVPLDGLTVQNTRLEHDGKTYDLVRLDNPMGLNRQWEFYLRMVD